MLEHLADKNQGDISFLDTRGTSAKNSKKNQVGFDLTLYLKSLLEVGPTEIFGISEISALEIIKHISQEAEVETDLWSGYKPLKGDYTIKQEKSRPGENFNLIHRCIQQLKGWARGTHLQGYLDEYCFHFNRHAFNRPCL